MNMLSIVRNELDNNMYTYNSDPHMRQITGENYVPSASLFCAVFLKIGIGRAQKHPYFFLKKTTQNDGNY
jgi:hypothetical protein